METKQFNVRLPESVITLLKTKAAARNLPVAKYLSELVLADDGTKLGTLIEKAEEDTANLDFIKQLAQSSLIERWQDEAMEEALRKQIE